MGVDGSGTVCDGHGLRDEAGASRYLPIDGCGRSQKAVRELVRVGFQLPTSFNRQKSRKFGKINIQSIRFVMNLKSAN